MGSLRPPAYCGVIRLIPSGQSFVARMSALLNRFLSKPTVDIEQKKTV